MNKDIEKIVPVFKALGDINRLMILDMLKDGERCSSDLLRELKITQPTLSHHIRVLSESGIITGRRDGKNIYYTVAEDFLERITKYLNSVIEDKKTAK